MGGNINLTKIWMASILAVFVAVIIFGNYIGFCSLHLPGEPPQCNIEPKYQAVFGNITTQYEGLGLVAPNAGTESGKSKIQEILNFGSNLVTGTVNIFVLGLEAMGNFFNMIPIIGNILIAIGSVIPGFSGLVSLLILILGVYIGMRYIQSASNKNELP
jgi:hypothetical protein